MNNINKILISSTSSWWVALQHLLLTGLIFFIPVTSVFGFTLAWTMYSKLVKDQLTALTIIAGAIIVASFFATMLMKKKIEKIRIINFLKYAKIFSFVLSFPLSFLLLIEMIRRLTNGEIIITYISVFTITTSPLIYYFSTKHFINKK